MIAAADAPPPTCPTEGDIAPCAVATMEHFSKRMCGCKDKACVDATNEGLTKWGTEMAANPAANKQSKPDPDLAKKAGDIMTRYTDCMTKIMMADPGSTVPATPDPCGGGDNPCG